MYKIFISFFSFLAFTSTAQMDTTSKIISEIEVKATRGPIKTPFHISKLNASILQKLNVGYDIPAILQSLPSSVNSSDAGNNIGYTNLKIRGTDITRINITINGIPYNDPESQIAYFVNISDLISSSHSIQIVNGVGSSTNGVGAFGASVNIENSILDDTSFIKYQTGIGSFGTYRNTLLFNIAKPNQKFKAFIRLSNILSNGYIDRSGSILYSNQFNIAYTFNKKHEFKIIGMNGFEKTGQAWNGVDLQTFKNHPTYNSLGIKQDSTFYLNQTDNYTQKHFQTFLNSKWNTKLKSSIGLFLTKGKGYYEEYKSAQLLSNYGLSNVFNGIDTFRETNLVRQLWLKNTLYGAVFNLFFHQNILDNILGIHTNTYTGHHFGIIKNTDIGEYKNHMWYKLYANKSDLSLFDKISIQLNPLWSLYLDGQFRYVDYQIYGFKNNPDLIFKKKYSFFNPKAGVFFKEKLQKYTLEYYASLSLANKEPNREDFENNTTAAPKPERLNDFEMGAKFYNENYIFHLNFYNMNYKNQLVLTGKINEIGAYTRTNVDESFRRGIEVMAQWNFSPNVTLVGNINFSKNQVLKNTTYYDDYDQGTQIKEYKYISALPFSPSVVSYFSFQLHNQNKNIWQTEYRIKQVGLQYLDMTENFQRTIPAYTIHDWYVSKYFYIKKHHLQFYIQLNNILNRKYYANGYTYSYQYDGQFTTETFVFPQATRHFILGMNWEMK